MSVQVSREDGFTEESDPGPENRLHLARSLMWNISGVVGCHQCDHYALQMDRLSLCAGPLSCVHTKRVSVSVDTEVNDWCE